MDSGNKTHYTVKVVSFSKLHCHKYYMDENHRISPLIYISEQKSCLTLVIVKKKLKKIYKHLAEKHAPTSNHSLQQHRQFGLLYCCMQAENICIQISVRIWITLYKCWFNLYIREKRCQIC